MSWVFMDELFFFLFLLICLFSIWERVRRGLQAEGIARAGRGSGV